MRKILIVSWRVFILPIILCAASCASHTGGKSEDLPVIFQPRYAEGFQIAGYKDSLSRLIRVTAPWQEADSTAMDLLVLRNGESIPDNFTGQVIENNAERIALVSSSHIAFLDLLGKVNTVKAVSGAKFISNTYIQNKLDEIADIGYDTNPDMELLLNTQPDIVLLYGIRGANPIEKKLKSLNIPYIYLGEYLEPDPLGKTEWIYVLGEITGSKDKAHEVFQWIEKRYLGLKTKVTIALEASTQRPKIMLNVPYGTTWFMSSSISTISRLIQDAGAQYIYQDNKTNRSLPIDIEKAWMLASESDFWLNTGQISSLDELKDSYPQFFGISCVQNKKVWNCDLRTTEGGGNDFWESGAVRADLVLEDLVRIFHPEILEDGPMHYYRNLGQ